MVVTPFANAGGYTVFDNTILDHVMAAADPNTWKVLCAVIRLTVGWQKKRDVIAYSQLMKLTGIASRSTLTNALQDAITQGYIVRVKARNSYAYMLNAAFTIVVPDEDETPVVVAPDPGPIAPKETKKRDDRLDHPAIIAYRSECRLHVPLNFRDEVIGTVGDSPAQIDKWRKLMHAWIGYGFNKQNIVGMLEAFRNGGDLRNGKRYTPPKPQDPDYVNVTQLRLAREQ